MANPIGIGLMGGAAAVKLGSWGYNKFRQHRDAQAMLGNEHFMQTMRQGMINVDNEGINEQYSYVDRALNSPKMLRQDNLRRQVAAKLVQGHHRNKGGREDKLLSAMGLEGNHDIDPEEPKMYQHEVRETTCRRKFIGRSALIS